MYIDVWLQVIDSAFVEQIYFGPNCDTAENLYLKLTWEGLQLLYKRYGREKNQPP